MTTRLQIEADVVRQLIVDLGDMALAILPVPLSCTADGGSTTTLVDTKLGRGSRDSNAYDGRAIMFTRFDADGAAIRDTSAVNTAGFNGTSTLTYSPATTKAPDENQEYLMYPLGVGPEMVLEAIQRGLRMGEAPWMAIPSLVENAQFLSGSDPISPPSGWNNVGSPTSSGIGIPSQEDVMDVPGNRIRVVAAQASDGIETDDIPVSSKEILLVSVLVTGGDTFGENVTVVLRDQNNSIDIPNASGVVIDQFAIGHAGVYEVRFTATVPDTCERVRVRITASAATTFDIYSPVVVQSQSGRLMRLHTGLYREEQIRSWFRVPQGVAAPSGGSNIFLPYSNGIEPLTNPQRSIIRHEAIRYLPLQKGYNLGRFEDGAGGGNFAASPLWFPIKATDEPIGFMYMRPFEEASADLTTTPGRLTTISADREWIVAEALANLAIPGWRRKANDRARIMGYGSDPDLRITPNPPVAV